MGICLDFTQLAFFFGVLRPPPQPTIGYRGKSGLTDSLSTNVCFSNLNAPNRMSLAAPVAEISEARDANPPYLAWIRGCPKRVRFNEPF